MPIISGGSGNVSPAIDYAQITTPATSTAASEGTATAIITGSAVTYDGVTRVFIEFFCPSVQVASGASPIRLVVFDGSTPLGWISDDALGTAYGLSVNAAAKYGGFRVTPTAAAHTFSIRCFGGGGTITIQAGVGGAGALAPAFMRITRA